VTVYKTSTYSTHHTCLHRCSVSLNHLRYHIATGIGIGTRIGIGAGKKYRVSEVSVNPGIGLSLVHTGISWGGWPCQECQVWTKGAKEQAD